MQLPPPEDLDAETRGHPGALGQAQGSSTHCSTATELRPDFSPCPPRPPRNLPPRLLLPLQATLALLAQLCPSRLDPHPDDPRARPMHDLRTGRRPPPALERRDLVQPRRRPPPAGVRAPPPRADGRRARRELPLADAAVRARAVSPCGRRTRRAERRAEEVPRGGGAAGAGAG